MIIPSPRGTHDVKPEHANVNGGPLTIVHEALLPGFDYYVQPDEMIAVLGRAGSDAEGIVRVVFRQPTRKQDQQSPNWASYRDGSVFVSAIDVSKPMRWPLSLSVKAKKELAALRTEGHGVIQDKRHYIITSTPQAVKQTQLGRSLPHEIGHHVYAKSKRAGQSSEEFAANYAKRFATRTS